MKKPKILLLISLFICLLRFSFPGDFLSLLKRGLLAFNQKDYRTAIDYFSRALKSPTRSSDKKVLIIAFNFRGKAFYELREYDKALIDFAKVKELNPKFAEVFNNCGRVYYDLHEHKKAIENYTEAIRLDRKYIDALCNRGLVFLAKGEYKNSVEDFNEAIRLNPEYTKAYSNVGMSDPLGHLVLFFKVQKGGLTCAKTISEMPLESISNGEFLNMPKSVAL